MVSSIGFNLALPFLPLYLGQLHTLSGGSVVLWTGVVFAAPALGMMLAAPVWGWVADRYGRKLMLVRATFSGAVILALMGLVQSVEQLTVLRVLQGLLTGYIPAVNALAAATVPADRAGASFGLLRTATWVGSGLGPLVGGVMAEQVGFRESFWLAGALLGLTGLLVLLFVQESFEPPAPRERRSFVASYRLVLGAPGLRWLYTLSLLDNLARSLIVPLIPLFMLALMGTSGGVASMTGLLFGIRATVAALAAVFLGYLGDRYGHVRVIAACAASLVALYIPQPFVTSAWQLIALQALTGVAAVGIIPNLSSLLMLRSPEGSSGATYGLDTSFQSLARAVGPLLGAGVASAFGLGSAFGFVALIYLVAMVIAGALSGRGADAGRRAAGEPAAPSLGAR